MKTRSVCLVLLGVVVLLSNLGCPTLAGPGGDPDELEFSYELTALKGLCLIWYRDRAINNPNTISLGPLPSNVQFNRFPVWAGAFAINNDFRGDNEFQFEVIGNNGNQAFVDFNGNRQLNAEDIPIIFNPSNRMITVNNPFGGMNVAPGAYALMLYPGVASPRGDAENEFELPLRMTRGSTSWNWTLLASSTKLYYPQVAFGRSGDLQIGTRFPTTNPNGTPLGLKFNFFTNSGSALNVRWDSVTGSTFTETISPKLSRTFEIAAEGALMEGWGEAVGTQDFTSSSTFTTRSFTLMRSPQSLDSTPQQSEELVGEAGITASRLSTSHLIEVRKTANDDTAFAVVNPTSKDLTLKFTLRTATIRRSNRSQASRCARRTS